MLIIQSPQKQAARKLRERRKILGLSQSEVARRAGTSQAAIARLEAGLGNPTVDLIQRVVTVLDFDLTLHIWHERVR